MKIKKLFIPIMSFGMVFASLALVTGCGNPPAPEKPTLTSIAVTTAPLKTSYFAGEVFDYFGMVVTGTYSNGTTSAIPFNAGGTEGYSFDKTGELSSTDTLVTVSYLEKTATTPINVKDSLGIIRNTVKLNFDAVDLRIKNFSTYQPDMTGNWKETYKDSSGADKGECIAHLVKGSEINFPFVVTSPVTATLKMKLAKYEAINAKDALALKVDGQNVITNDCTLGKKSEDSDADRYWNWKEWTVNSAPISLENGVHTFNLKGIHDAGVPNILSYEFSFVAA